MILRVGEFVGRREGGRKGGGRRRALTLGVWVGAKERRSLAYDPRNRFLSFEQQTKTKRKRIKPKYYITTRLSCILALPLVGVFFLLVLALLITCTPFAI